MSRLYVKVLVVFGYLLLAVNSQAQTPAEAAKAAAAAAGDAREDFEATFYTGASIDSFAAEDLNKYLNPRDSATKKLGYVAGADFAYRVIGEQASPKPQLWVYGQTVHGQRSAEVDCTSQPGSAALPEQCGLDGFVPRPGAFLGILRNASSLEGFGGMRFELLTLHKSGDNAVKLYLKSELGFLSVSGSGGDVLDSHQRIAVGLLSTKGLFQDSFLETGWGKSDVFRTHPGRRFKIDGYLSWNLNDWMKTHGMKPFLEITVDSDFGRGADSIRSFYGFNFDLKLLAHPTN